MIDFLLLIFLITLMISLYALIISYRRRTRSEENVYYTAEENETENS